MGKIWTGGWRWRSRWILGIGDSERLKRWAASGLVQVDGYCIGGGGEKVWCHGYTSWTQSPSLFGPLISGGSLLGPLNTFWKPDKGYLLLQVSEESCKYRMWDVGGGRHRRMSPSSGFRSDRCFTPELTWPQQPTQKATNGPNDSETQIPSCWLYKDIPTLCTDTPTHDLKCKSLQVSFNWRRLLDERWNSFNKLILRSKYVQLSTIHLAVRITMTWMTENNKHRTFTLSISSVKQVVK